jgi:hypothetical protein
MSQPILNANHKVNFKSTGWTLSGDVFIGAGDCTLFVELREQVHQEVTSSFGFLSETFGF